MTASPKISKQELYEMVQAIADGIGAHGHVDLALGLSLLSQQIKDKKEKNLTPLAVRTGYMIRKEPIAMAHERKSVEPHYIKKIYNDTGHLRNAINAGSDTRYGDCRVVKVIVLAVEDLGNAIEFRNASRSRQKRLEEEAAARKREQEQRERRAAVKAQRKYLDRLLENAATSDTEIRDALAALQKLQGEG